MVDAPSWPRAVASSRPRIPPDWSTAASSSRETTCPPAGASWISRARSPSSTRPSSSRAAPRCGCRTSDCTIPQHGHGRACQTLTVKPFRYYHVSAAVKTQDFESAGEVQIAVLGKDGTALNYHKPHVERTQDWKRIDVTFNSLEFSQVNLYLGIWGGRRGKIWWDDVRLEPGGLVNVVRRDGAPLRATSADGQIVYQEGRDFQNARDPKLGMIPWPGGFTAWHEPPVVTLPSAAASATARRSCSATSTPRSSTRSRSCAAWPSRSSTRSSAGRSGRSTSTSSRTAISSSTTRSACRAGTKAAASTGKTPGELLAENVHKCVELVRAEDAGKPVYVWSDMFDPSHNAQKAGRYYLVKGDGPWYGSWKGLDKDVVIVNWNSAPDKRSESLRHFAGLGHRQILAGYYDGPVGAIRGLAPGWRAGAGDRRGDVHDLAAPVSGLGSLCRPVEATLSWCLAPKASANGNEVRSHVNGSN